MSRGFALDTREIKVTPELSDDNPPTRLHRIILGTCILGLAVHWIISQARSDSIFQHTIDYYFRSLPKDGETLPVNQDICDLHDPDEDPLPAVRTAFGSRATIVYGWPSTGGVWVHEQCYGVELNFLGVDRFNASATQRESDSQQEDEFCKRLEWIGGTFKETELDYNRHRPSREDIELFVGWAGEAPDGGAWVLRTNGYADGGRADIGVSRVRNALSMKERCKAIEMLGGKFYEKWEDVSKEQRGEEGEQGELTDYA